MHKYTSSGEPSKQNSWHNDAVIGFSDGLVIPFALAAGLSGAVDSTNIIVIAGLAQIVAGSIAMGVGGYYSGKPEQHHHSDELKRTRIHESDPQIHELTGTIEFFANLGLTEELQKQALAEVAKDKNQWAEFVSRYDGDTLNLKTAKKSALLIASSYIAGGLLPLFPYFFIKTPTEALKISALTTLVFLFVFGWFKSKITGDPLFLGAVRATLIGAAAAAAAFGVAKIFEAA